MKKLLTILFAIALGLNLNAQTDYVDDWNPDADGDDLIGITDLLALLSLFAEADSDGDGIWDSVDDCIGVYDPCGVCNGTGEDADEDGLCDDVDDCLGAYDECGVCNGPGPSIPIIDEIVYATDSVFLEPLDEWYVFEYATDTLYTFVCPVAGCTDETALNYNPEAVIGDGSCVMDWSQLGEDIDGEAEDDWSGYSVSFSSDGTIVAIGAIYNDGNGSQPGHTRIYVWEESSWSQLGEDIDGEAADDNSGLSVSLSADGTVVAIGATSNDENGSFSGHTRIYSWDGSSWSQLGEDIDGEAEGDISGRSVSLSSDGAVVAIGASSNDGNGSLAGHTRIYVWDESSWSQLGGDIDGEAEGDYSGYSVSLSADGTVVAIGARYNDGDGNDSGHTRIYAWDGSSWSQLGGDIDGEAEGDLSSRSVSLSSDGTVVAIGAIGNDGNGSQAGHTRIYVWDESSWSQLGGDIDGEAEGDYSGNSVSLSSDGTVVAIGAPYNDGNGSNSGHTRIYSWDGSSWSQLGEDIDGEAEGDYSGSSVSLSSDGTAVAIGAYRNDGNGSNSGHTRIYSIN